MIPLRDSETTRRLTPINTILIIANVAVFVLEARLGRHAGLRLARYAMVPSQIVHLHLSAPGHAMATLATFITSTFLHAGFIHIAGNMLYLFIFGPAIEERLGTPRYLYFYFAAAIAAGLAMVAMGPESPVPVIGASGAIAGVLGAYFVIYPRGRITTILPLFFFWSKFPPISTCSFGSSPNSTPALSRERKDQPSVESLSGHMSAGFSSASR
jgi:rhomboid family protein